MHSFTVQIAGEGDALVEAQVVQAHLGMSLEILFGEIYDLKLEGRLRTEMLIVRLPVEENWTAEAFTAEQVAGPTLERTQRLFARREAGGDIFARVRDRAVHVLTSNNGRHVLTSNLNPHWAEDPLERYGIAATKAFNAISKAEFEYILNRSRAVLMSAPGSMFRAPSGRLIRSFVRVGNIQYDRDAIDAVFFWLLPHLDSVGAILTDTWSISSIALNMARLCAAYFGGDRRVVEMLPSYNDGSPEAKARTRTVIERLDADYRTMNSDQDVMLCLISATQTGSLARHLTDIFETSALQLRPRPIALFALGDTDIPHLHDLTQDSRFKLLEEPAERASEPVKIDPQVYFPLRFEDTVIEISKSVADRARPFFDRYVGTGLIEVHRTHSDGAGRVRHHAVHLVTERLVEVRAFVEAFNQKLADLPTRPKLIVSPPHPAGRALAELARDHFARADHICPVFAHDTLYLRAEDVALREILASAEEADSLLVVDDVLLTGTRLAQYQRYTRTAGYRGRIDYLVGIARPEDPQVWAKAKQILTWRGATLPRHTLNCVDMVTLPDWREPDCPWCTELRLYSRWSQIAPLPEQLASRREVLQGAAATGLTSELFLQIPNIPALALGPNSFFTNQTAHQAEVFAAVAAALQHLRTEITSDRPQFGPRHFPISTVLNHDDYLCAKWTDSILRATFLRAAIVDELTYADFNKEHVRTRQLMDLVVQDGEGEHDIAPEVLLAAALGKCRVLVGEDLRARLEAFGVGEVGTYLLDRLGDEVRPA
ncbi:hypothetical protein [Bradyrhizobium sp. RT11b]|uniref:hypothetical protein n=1 Tax=Bradyrhizobium sp. RT11b TaxID=3156332 RepID=UPI0033981017